MEESLEEPHTYPYIISDFTPRTFKEGWNRDVPASTGALGLIKISSIHVEDTVTVDVELCAHYSKGRTLKEWQIPKYKDSFTVSD